MGINVQSKIIIIPIQITYFVFSISLENLMRIFIINVVSLRALLKIISFLKDFNKVKRGP